MQLIAVCIKIEIASIDESPPWHHSSVSIFSQNAVEERHAARDAGLRRSHPRGDNKEQPRSDLAVMRPHFCSGACDATNAPCTK